jgi:hypothetical protein
LENKKIIILTQVFWNGLGSGLRSHLAARKISRIERAIGHQKLSCFKLLKGGA